YLLDQHTIEGHKRKFRGQVRRQWMVAQRRLQARQSSPNHLFERLPFFVHLDSAGLQARHLQQVVHQAIEPSCFFVVCLLELVAKVSSKATCSGVSKRRGWAGRTPTTPTVPRAAASGRYSASALGRVVVPKPASC